MGLSAPPASPSYPVLFCLLGETPIAGSLTVGADQMLLQGGSASSSTTLQIAFSELREVRIARSPAGRLNGRSVLVLDRAGEPPVCVAPLGPGLLHEIADLIATFVAPTTRSSDRINVVVPLKPGMRARVRKLVAAGAPIDPAELGLQEHTVSLHDDVVVFTFVGPQVRRKIERAAHDPALWRTGLAWRSCIAAGPRLTTGTQDLEDRELLYSWRSDGGAPPA